MVNLKEPKMIKNLYKWQLHLLWVVFIAFLCSMIYCFATMPGEFRGGITVAVQDCHNRADMMSYEVSVLRGDIQGVWDHFTRQIDVLKELTK